MKARRKRYWIRLQMCWHVLFGRGRHAALIMVDTDELVKQFKGEDYEARFLFAGLQNFNFWHLMHHVADTKDVDEVILMKAEFEADADEYSRKH